MMNNKKVIFIIGLPGSGKSAMSKMLANNLNYNLYDTDSYIEKKENKTITDIFTYNGENYFRDIESYVLEEISNLSDIVVSTGGGIILREKNRKIMNENGLTIFIDRKPEIILKNINIKKRPLLAKNKNKLLELSKERDTLYKETANIIFTHNTWENDINDTFKKFYESIINYIK